MSGTAKVVEPAEADGTTNARHVARGAVWMVAAQVIHLLTHTKHAIAPARMLPPEAFGAFAGHPAPATSHHRSPRAATPSKGSPTDATR